MPGSLVQRNASVAQLSECSTAVVSRTRQRDRIAAAMRSRSPSPVEHIRQLAALRPCSHAFCHTPVPRGWISLGGSHFGATRLTTRLAFALAASLGLAMPSYSIAAPATT